MSERTGVARSNEARRSLLCCRRQRGQTKGGAAAATRAGQHQAGGRSSNSRPRRRSILYRPSPTPPNSSPPDDWRAEPYPRFISYRLPYAYATLATTPSAPHPPALPAHLPPVHPRRSFVEQSPLLDPTPPPLIVLLLLQPCPSQRPMAHRPPLGASSRCEDS